MKKFEIEQVIKARGWETTGLFSTDDDDQLVTSGDTRVKQVSLKHHILLGVDWQHHT